MDEGVTQRVRTRPSLQVLIIQTTQRYLELVHEKIEIFGLRNARFLLSNANIRIVIIKTLIPSRCCAIFHEFACPASSQKFPYRPHSRF